MAAHASEPNMLSNYFDDNHMNKMRDFVKYLKQNQIEYMKNKNGMPDMRYGETKLHFRQFLTEQVEQLNIKMLQSAGPRQHQGGWNLTPLKKHNNPLYKTKSKHIIA